MYKLFINSLQVGNYDIMTDMVTSAIMVYGRGKIPKSVRWDGDKLFITYYEKWELKR